MQFDPKKEEEEKREDFCRKLLRDGKYNQKSLGAVVVIIIKDFFLFQVLVPFWWPSQQLHLC